MKRTMTTMSPEEKKLVQAQHRLEAAQARERDKQRRQRTHRLIQTGAILEKLFPEFRTMELDDVELELERRLGTTESKVAGTTQAPGVPVRAHVLATQWAAVSLRANMRDSPSKPASDFRGYRPFNASIEPP